MAVTPVSLGPSLRAWSLAGVTHILCDGPVDPVYLGGEGAAPARTAPRPPFQRPGQPSGAVPGQAPDAARAGQGMPPAAPAKDISGEASPGVKSTAGERPSAGPEAARAPRVPAGTALAFAPATGAPDDPAAWPDPWKGWFARITPAPVLWTYHELGADLTGIGRSAERSAFFKNLIGELGLPKGSSVFWPSAMPVAEGGEDAALQPHPAVFSAGLARLRPQVVIVFGEAAMADMGLAGRIRPFRQEMVEGKLLLCLPEIGALLQNQGQRASSVSLLRAVLLSVSYS
ncbi:conserved hypothetical protein [uncultured delta proteobacterium]|uniref:Uracil-DNA glycosylase-like domain-containing protein n=1 Tax=uncultured delta proteobacterium TaxID=34034 RepID=A0A212JZ74_9DELT|nr:conserved hypothetical protein [uncultured delta proteobacterium]